MQFKKNEKEILKAIVKYGDEVTSLADVINKSGLLEKRGIVVAFAHETNNNFVFYSNKKYKWNDKRVMGYVTEMISLVRYLVENRYITVLPFTEREPYVIGRKFSKLKGPALIEVDDAIINLDQFGQGWADKKGRGQLYNHISYPEKEYPITASLSCWFAISQDLRDLVENDFKSEEQIRFEKQQRLTWISIILAFLIGIASIIISLVK